MILAERNRKVRNLSQLIGSAITLALLLPSAALANNQCQALFTEGPKALLTEKPEVALTDLSQKLRKALISTGPVDTTRLRSEFKHYNLELDSDRTINWLKREFPPVYSSTGALLSGLANRDEKVRVGKEELIQALDSLGRYANDAERQQRIANKTEYGRALVAAIESHGLLKAVSDPAVLAQHRLLVESKVSLAELAVIDRLHSQKVAELKARGRSGYTDTASTGKFIYLNDLSERAVSEGAQEFQPPITGVTAAINLAIRGLALKQAKLATDPTAKFENLAPVREALRRQLITAGNLGADVDAFLTEMQARSIDAGVIRYRKYRTGAEQTALDGIPAPGSPQPGSAKGITDAAFANGVTWLEFKMKASEGEESLSTVVNKPRFPLTDAVFPMIQNPLAFKTDEAFAKTSELLKRNIKANIDISRAQGVEATYVEAEADSMLELVRALHAQNFNFAPVTRTAYMRDSYNINLLDIGGKAHNIQVTRDRQVWQLDRKTGARMQALPFYEAVNGWQFQFEADSGWFVHRDPQTGAVLHLMDAFHPEKIYDTDRRGNLRPTAGPVNPKPVEVVELKVPLEFIRLTDADVARVSDLAKIRIAKKAFIDSTHALNTLRRQADLEPFTLNLGKSGTARKDMAGGIRLRVSDNGRRDGHLLQKEFSFNPESGYWINWAGETPRYFYRPGDGLKLITNPRSIDWKNEAVDVYGFVEDPIQPSYDQFRARGSI